MFAVAWGAHAASLLEHAGTGSGRATDRVGDLAVIDAESATEDGWRCWISGRLTNAVDLQRQLGLPPSAPDAVVLAHAFTQLGESACRALRGTYIVVAFDRDRDRASILRDHLGGRPLVLSRLRGGALLAEHERAILEALPSIPGPDRLALTQWIEQGSMPSEHTLFDGLRRIPPAHIVRLCADCCEVERYWRPRYQGVAKSSRLEIADRLRGASFAAVQRAAAATQTPAVLLSGGLDSSCVAAGLAARSQPAPQALALSGVFPTHPDADERDLIEATASHTRLPAELIPFDDHASILAPALSHLERWSLPPVTPNLFAWEPVMARARELGVDAMLDGEGGDELFAFAPHLIADMLRSGRALAAWRLTHRIPGIGSEADTRLRLRALRVYGTSRLLPRSVKSRRTRRRALHRHGSLLQAADRATILELECDATPISKEGPLWWRGLAESIAQPGEALGASAHLRRVATDERIDRRHPFLFDLDLLETVLAHPPQMLFDFRDRALLRDALVGHIPEAVRTRHVKSFFTDLLPAGLAADGPLLAAGLARREAPVRAFVRPEALDALLHDGLTPRENVAARRLWHLGLADVWLRTLESPEHLDELLERSASRRAGNGSR